MEHSEKIRRRYDRIAGVFNFMDRAMTKGTNKWREKPFTMIKGTKILEIGVGTGANLPYYSPEHQVTAIDFSSKMLRHAHNLVNELELNVTLLEMDAQNLSFDDHTFDTVLTSCVFCSVPAPLLGLSEIKRVLKPHGRLVMLEHVLSDKPVLNKMMNVANPLVVKVSGANINRTTKFNLEKAGFDVEEEDLWLDILKLFVATPKELHL